MQIKKKILRSSNSPSYTFKERSIRWFLRSLAYMTVGITVLILLILLSGSLNFFNQISILDYITGTQWQPFAKNKKLGMLPLVSGSLMVAFGACLIAVPFGLGVAIYLTQYASGKVRDIISPLIEVLGGIPSIVYGYFALITVTPFLKIFFPGISTFNALSASIVVGIAILPMISSISGDALSLVPKSIQYAGYALGMRKLYVVIKIIIPAAASGITSSIILAFARAIGETMAVTLAAGATPNMNFNYLEGIQTITAFIVQVSLGDVPAGSIEYYTLYALALTLFLMTFLFNHIAGLITRRYKEQYE